jgi:phosphoglycolate phosphatase-like HAD superfamily hydrolase
MGSSITTALFDLDGTLVDSDDALLAPFTALGVPPERVPPLGLPLAEACALAGILVEDYVAHYDDAAVHPFPGVEDLVRSLPRWAVCSNKRRASGLSELARLGWEPELALFSEDFDLQQKRLAPVLAALELDPAAVVFVGDTDHDRTCAVVAGVRFALAGWNPRVTAVPGDLVLGHPLDVLELLET